MEYAETPAMLIVKLDVVKSFANRYDFCKNHRRFTTCHFDSFLVGVQDSKNSFPMLGHS